MLGLIGAPTLRRLDTLLDEPENAIAFYTWRTDNVDTREHC